MTVGGHHPQRPFVLPPGATEIVVVRHGATIDALPGSRFPMVDGRGDPPLSEAGEAQARAVADRLADEELAGLFVTPLQRTSQTAAPLAGAVGLVPVVVPELAEVRLGDWEGGEYRKRAIAGDPVVVRAFEEERWDVIPNAESPEEIEARVRAGVLSVVDAVGPDAVAAVVVHGGIVGEIGRQATGSRPFAFVHADNGSITRLVVLPGGRWLLRSFNDVAHLAVRTGPAG